MAVRRDVLEGAEALLHARHPLAVRPAKERTTKKWVRKNKLALSLERLRESGTIGRRLTVAERYASFLYNVVVLLCRCRKRWQVTVLYAKIGRPDISWMLLGTWRRQITCTRARYTEMVKMAGPRFFEITLAAIGRRGAGSRNPGLHSLIITAY